jgi:hypothetical protein
VTPPRDGTDHLRVLIANERKDRLDLILTIVAGLGHEVIAMTKAHSESARRAALQAVS